MGRALNVGCPIVSRMHGSNDISLSLLQTPPAGPCNKDATQAGRSRMPIPADDRLVDILRQTTVALVRGEERDLTARQLAVFLICYLASDKQTVRGLADQLRIPTPSVTRALDLLEELGLAQRQPDQADRRSVLVGRTVQGNAFLRDLSKVMAGAERATRSAQSARK
jgi:DNA-binding MarR family transcriptional regulator